MAYRYVQNKASAAEIFLYDDIGDGWFGGVSSKQFASDLRSFGDVKDITVRIDSAGGNVFVGHVMYNLLREHDATITVKIDGMAASIASVIAMAGDDIEISENAVMMVHNPWGVAIGESEDIRKEADRLVAIRSSIVSAYVGRTKQEEAKISEFMNAETWLSADQAVELGFADRLNQETLLAASAADWRRYRYQNVPELPKAEVVEFPRRKENAVRFARIDNVMTKYKL